MKTLTSLGATLTLLAAGFGPRLAQADTIPIAVSGLNQDMVVEAGAVNDPTSHYLNAVTATMDAGTAKTGFTWYESGLAGGTGGGLPASGVITSTADPTTRFQLGPYTGPNALLLDSGNTSGTLTFKTPQEFSGLSFLTTTGSAFFGTPIVSLTLHFADGSTAVSGLSFVSPDWFTSIPAAVSGNGRIDPGTAAFDQVGSGNPRIFQENVTLPASVWAHPIASIDLSWNSGGSNNSETAIFAISGTVPEPASLGLLGIGMAAVALGARHRAARRRA